MVSRNRILLLSIPLIITFTTIGLMSLFSSKYLTVSDLTAINSSVKVSVIGNISAGSVRYRDGLMTFILTDGRSSVKVMYRGFLQLDNSTSLARVTVMGIYYPDKGYIEARNVLFKCPSKQEIEGYKYRLNETNGESGDGCGDTCYT